MKKIINIVGTLLSISTIISLIVFDTFLIESNLLKSFLIIILTIAELVFIVFPYFVKNKIKYLFIYLLSIILIVANCFGSVTIKKVIDALDDIDDNNEVHEITHDYILYTNEDSQISKIEDIKGLVVGVFDNQVVLEVLETLIDENTIDIIIYDDIEKLLKALNSHKVSSIFISGETYTLIEDEYSTDLHLKEVIRKTITESDEVNLKTVDLNKDVFNIYLMGSDYRENQHSNNTDVNIIVSVDTVKKKILLTSIPRDYYVVLAIDKENHDKLTHSAYYGTNCTIRTIENLLDIDINYYFRVGFDTVTKIVDALDGLDVYVDQDFTVGSYVYKKGIMHMNGAQALTFARERHSFRDGSNTRIRHQQELFKALLNTCMSSRTILNHYSDLIKVIADTFTTNMTSDDISELVKGQLLYLTNYSIEQQFLSGFAAYSTECYSYRGPSLWVMKQDPESVNQAKERIKAFCERSEENSND